MQSARLGVVILAAALGTAGCTFLVDFVDAGPAGIDASLDAESDAALVDVVTEGALDGGAPCSEPNGFNWNTADPYARCCAGKAVETNSNENCGACGIGCNVIGGQKCELFRGHYYCRHCESMPNTCWSGCCSTAFGGGSCAASVCATGACMPGVCPPGTTCVTPGDASNYCAYP